MIFGINQDIIQIYYNKDIKLFNKDFVDIALKIGCCVEKTKGDDLVFEIAIFGVKSRLLLIIFFNFHLMIGTSEIQLGKSLCLA